MAPPPPVRRKRVVVWPPWRRGVRQTYANAVACSIWTRPLISCAARCQHSPMRSGYRVLRPCAWPLPTLASWRSCWAARPLTPTSPARTCTAAWMDTITQRLWPQDRQCIHIICIRRPINATLPRPTITVWHRSCRADYFNTCLCCHIMCLDLRLTHINVIDVQIMKCVEFKYNINRYEELKLPI